MELIQIVNPDEKIMKEIIKIEEEAFEGNGNVDLWIIKALIKYGLVFVLKEGDNIISIIEYMQAFNKKNVFLYGISTLKKYRNRGHATFLLNETEKFLKDLNYQNIELTVDPKNIIAIKMYEKNNYKKATFLKDEYGKDIDRYLMIKKL